MRVVPAACVDPSDGSSANCCVLRVLEILVHPQAVSQCAEAWPGARLVPESKLLLFSMAVSACT